MAFLSTMNIIGSGLTAQQIRLDVISENITNLDVTSVAEGEGPYRRKVVRMQAETNKNGFRAALARAARRGTTVGNRTARTAGGVRVTEILEDESEFPIAYDPLSPDADEEGYVRMPNVTLVKEITDAMAASQAYNADVTMFNTYKQVVSRALDINV